MDEIKVYDAEYKFMDIVWNHSPIKSSKLVELAREKLGWKKSTTYTVIKRLCDRGIIENKDTMVYALVEREKVLRAESEEHINKFYGGSLKLFFSTFLKRERLTDDEISELKKIIEECEAEK
ncbi:MAG: BlaI/MecI/CopY family transcriptional regulator [Clostridiaceae bacterium]|nr:BlaI/MecI/CopY family transcriptional regulator [Clostridiaceae bacterium]